MKKFANLERLFFDYEEEKRAKIKDERLNLSSYKFLSRSSSRGGKLDSFAKQVMIKLLSNLSARGTKNALAYVIRNSEYDFALDENKQPVSLKAIMQDWQKDFSTSLNAKEAWHFVFSLDEEVNEQNLRALQESVDEVMQKNFYGYKYVSVAHTHQHKPHIHIILNKTNIFTRKKLHFKDRQDIKDFWNLLREDFKNSLNFHNPRFKYQNKYRYERDLLKESASRALSLPLNINENIAKQIISAESKINLYEKKAQTLGEKISLLMREKIQLALEAKNLIKMNDKRYFQKLKAIKEINAKLYILRQSKKPYDTHKTRLKAHIKELRLERLNYKNHYDTLAKKQAYLQFLQSKIRSNTHTKSDTYLMRQIENDIALNAKALGENMENEIKADVLMTRVLGKKTNAFSMISLAKDLDSHLRALSLPEVSAELKDKLQSYEKTLLENKAFVLEMCHNKAKSLQERQLKGEESAYRQKELNALACFLNAGTQYVREQKTARSENLIKQSSSLPSRLLIDEFLQWYCKKQDIRSLHRYEASLKEKIHNNTFENFTQLYSEFERDRDRGISR